MLCKYSLCFNNEWKAQVPHSGLKSGCRQDIFTSTICTVKAVEMHFSNEKIVPLFRLTLHFLLPWKLRISNVSYWQVLCINFTFSSSETATPYCFILWTGKLGTRRRVSEQPEFHFFQN